MERPIENLECNSTSPQSDAMEGSVRTFEQQLRTLHRAENLDEILSTASEMDDLDSIIQLVECLTKAARSEIPIETRLSLLSQLLEMRYERTENRADLENAIKYAEEAVEMTKGGHPDQAEMLYKLGSLLGTRYEESGDLQDLEDGIRRSQEAVQVMAPDDPNRADMMQSLGFILTNRYELQGDLEDLEEAIKLIEKAIDATSPEEPDRADKLCNLANYLCQRFSRLQNIDDLQDAIKWAKAAAAVESPDKLDCAKKKSNVSGFLFMRYEVLGTVEDLDEAIKLVDETLDVIPPDDPYRDSMFNNTLNYLRAAFQRLDEGEDVVVDTMETEEGIAFDPKLSDSLDPAEILHILGRYHWWRYQRSRELEDLVRAIRRTEEALELIPLEQPIRTTWMNNLVWLVSLSYDHRSTGGIETAIKQTQKVLELIPKNHPDRGKLLAKLGGLLFMRYQDCGDINLLSKAIESTEDAAEFSPEDIADLLELLSILQLERYQYSNDSRDLEQATNTAKKALSLTSTEDTNLTERLSRLGHLLQLCYVCQNTLDDLHQSIERHLQAYSTAPADHLSRVTVIDRLAVALFKRYERLGDFKDLEQAIKLREEGLTNPHLSQSDRPDMLAELGYCIGSRYKHLGLILDLEKAIKLGEEALADIPEADPRRIAHLGNLSTWYMSRHKRFGSQMDLEKAVALAEKAVVEAPSTYAHRELLLLNLSSHLDTRYSRLGMLSDFQEALRLTENALEMMPTVHPGRSSGLESKTHLLCEKYDRFGGVDDLEEAIRCGQEALESCPQDDSWHAVRLCTLGYLLCGRYERFGNPDDLECAVHRTEEAMARSCLDDPHRKHVLQCLARCLYIRYVAFSDLADLEKSIQLTDEALAATPTDHRDRENNLSNMASTLQRRYERFGDVSDLQRSIKLTSDAPTDQSNRVDRLDTIGSRFWNRYRRFEALKDLEVAIKSTKAALELAPRGHSSRASILTHLANQLSARFERLGMLDDIQQAITLGEEAAFESPSHSQYITILSNRSTYLINRYDKLREIEDLQSAIRFTQDALEATPENHPHRCGISINLATWFRKRYEQLGVMQDLQDALHHAKTASSTSPPDHPDRAFILSTTGGIIELLLPKDLTYCISLYLDAWNCNNSPPATRIEAAYKGAILMARQHMWQEAYSLLAGAVQTLSKISPQWIERDDQQHMLSKFSTLTAEAASVALEAGVSPSKCVTLLELGRAIILGLTIDCRSDISDLAKKHPHVFDKLDGLRKDLDSQHKSDRLNDITDEMDATLAFIRQLPGFELFQLPPTPEALMAISADGPIVIVNSTQFRSDALLVTDSTIRSLPLPDLLFEDIKIRIPQIGRLTSGKGSTYPLRNKQLTKILVWLWDVVVEPVFKALQIYPQVDEHGSLPHVNWIGIGLLALSPLHAAGDHSPNSKRNTISTAVSSYIPTIKALIYARQKRLNIVSGLDSRVLLVAMPTTPENRPLRHALSEVKDIVDAIEGRSITTELNSPCTEDVLMNLPQFNVIHFACHAVSDSKNPSNSHLLLLKNEVGSASETIDRLTVKAISSTTIEHAQLAYLSACCTADNPAESLADEWIHLASAFQLAGFSHVLATLWESNDAASRQVARDFYRQLYENASDEHRMVRSAFHRAVSTLRDQYWRQPIIWASFIHTGA